MKDASLTTPFPPGELQSKYRHVYGEKAKVHYENVKISGSAWDTDLVSAGGKYLAVNWQAAGGGVSHLNNNPQSHILKTRFFVDASVTGR